jgi:hypothetical protein
MSALLDDATFGRLGDRTRGVEAVLAERTTPSTASRANMSSAIVFGS